MAVTRTQSSKQKAVKSPRKTNITRKQANEKPVADLCRKCNRKVAAKAQAVRCDSCDWWIHCSCCGIPKELYECLQKYDVPAVRIVCHCCSLSEKVCSPPAGVDHSKSFLTDTNTPKPGVNVHEFRSDMDTSDVYKSIASTPVTQKTYAEVVNDCPRPQPNLPRKTTPRAPPPVSDVPLLRNITNPPVADSSQIPPKKSGNAAPNHNRKQCLIMFNAPEPEGDSAVARIEQEREFLQSVFKKLFDPGEQGVTVVSAFRLGRKSAEPGSPRVLKIVLSSEDEARRVLRKVYRLKDESFRILRDLSPEERVKMREATQELKRRREAGETDIKIVDFRVVKKKVRARWKPLAIGPHLILL